MNAARSETRGWLSEHALRSGLTEQYATEIGGATIVVELRWVRHHDNYQVAVVRDGSRMWSAEFASLEEARSAFTRRMNAAANPGKDKQ